MPGPPPPPAPPMPAAGKSQAPAPVPVNALLKQIQKGTRLKKAETNDRSSPIVDSAKPAAVPKSSAAPSNSGSAMKPSPSTSGGPQMGGLFAGGMPQLKPVNTSGFGAAAPLKKSQDNLAVPFKMPVSRSVDRFPGGPSLNVDMKKNLEALSPGSGAPAPPSLGSKPLLRRVSEQPPSSPARSGPPPLPSVAKPTQLSNQAPPALPGRSPSIPDIANSPKLPVRTTPVTVSRSRENVSSAPILNPPPLPSNKPSIGGNSAPPIPGSNDIKRPPPPPVPGRSPSSTPSAPKPPPPVPTRQQQPPPPPSQSMEQESRWQFHSVRDLPQPRTFNPALPKQFLSGSRTGTSFSIDALMRSIQINTMNAGSRILPTRPPPPVPPRV